MPRPCHSPTIPCRQGFRLCLSYLICTVQPCLIDTTCCARTMPRPCSSESDFSGPRHNTTWAWNGMACVRQYRPSRDGIWATCLPSTSSGYHAEFHGGYQKHTNPLNCRSGSSDISGYHPDFSRRTRHCRRMGGARNSMCELTRHGMARQGNGMGAEWHMWISLKVALLTYFSTNLQKLW
jgi:hypothetical protein